MDNSEHCKICDHKVMDIITGITCSKTKNAPDFKRKCDIISLKEEMEARILEVNVKLELVLLTKVDTVFHVSFFSLLSLTLIFVGCYFVDAYALEMYKSLDKRDTYNLVAIFVVLFAGFLVLPIAIGPFNNYRRKLSIAKVNKMRLDKVLKLYGWSYKLKLYIGKEIHGDRKINHDLKMFRVKAER